MKKLWFRRKTYGYGWTPVTWEGWTVILLYLLLLLGTSALGRYLLDPRTAALTMVLSILISTSILLWICVKNGETPRWQWGKKKDPNS